MTMEQSKNLGIYVHIPFCLRKCEYCSFFSLPVSGQQAGYEGWIKREAELRVHQAAGWTADTLYFGGGTPSCLEARAVPKMLQALRQNFAVAEDAEITCEANPETVTQELLEGWAQAGINRISLGAQAAQDELLRMLGRGHVFEDFAKAVSLAQRSGFSNISEDLMFGLPGQSCKMWEESVKRVADLGVEHLSCYALHVEKGTPLADRIASGEIALPDEELVMEMLARTGELLQPYGLQRYEISNYAKPGRQSRHNLKYWNDACYLGLGAGAHGCIRQEDGRLLRYENAASLQGYQTLLRKDRLPELGQEEIPEQEEMFEYVMLKTRLTEGIGLLEFRARFGKDFWEVYGDAAAFCIQKKLAELKNGRFFLTERGMEIQNSVLMRFMD